MTPSEPAPAVRVPGDKSIAHRSLMLAALAHGRSRIHNLPRGLDVLSTQRVLRGLGVPITNEGDVTVVDGRGGDFAEPREPLDCGNSGTTIRLMSGLLATRPITVTLDGDASLRRRPMRRVADPLAAFGARLTLTDAGTAPIAIAGNGDARGTSLFVAVPSAQVKSALILAALGAHGRSRITGELTTRDHTERLLRAFGVVCAFEGEALLVDGPARLQATEVTVPGDMSSAAFLLAAAAVVPGARVTIEEVGLNPTRIAFLDVLRRFGAEVEVVETAPGAEPRGRVSVRGGPLHAIAIEPWEVPGLIDELPIIGVIGAFARGTTTVRGASELRVKESDRIESFAAAARALGIEVTTAPDGFAVRGPARLRSGTVVTAGDHRIAMAFLVAGRAAGVAVALDDPECMAVSFPGFAGALEAVA
jgi:3-phosphoshikimate 1-carboxyvinyltransferase